MDYDSITAHYYAAYRPPLHAELLSRVLEGRYDYGLDIGCGTGHSTRALKAYCDRVTGLDSSADMLARAPAEPGIHYQAYAGDRLPALGRPVDIVTFAGSINYCKSQQLVDDVTAVCRPGALVVLYDFWTNLGPIAQTLFGLEVPTRALHNYDPTLTLAGLELKGLREVGSTRDAQHVRMRPEELAYLLLSERDLLHAVFDRYGSDRPVKRLLEGLRLQISERYTSVEVPFELFTAGYVVS